MKKIIEYARKARDGTRVLVLRPHYTLPSVGVQPLSRISFHFNFACIFSNFIRNNNQLQKEGWGRRRGQGQRRPRRPVGVSSSHVQFVTRWRVSDLRRYQRRGYLF